MNTLIYNIEGMTCNNCVGSVKSKLEASNAILNVQVDLEKGEVKIISNKRILLEELQSLVPSKYKISEIETDEKNVQNVIPVTSQKTKLEELKPLFLILFYIGTASVLLHSNDWDAQAMMMDFMGLFFIVFSFFKILDLQGFPETFKMYDPLAKRLSVYASIYPFIETALGLMFLFRFKVEIALVVTIVVLGITTAGVTRSLMDKKQIRCACLGTALDLPMTEATFIENAIMLLMAIMMLLSLVI